MHSVVTVGIRQLKNRLSEYLRLVRAGELVLITDRGQVIAKLAPAVESTRESDLFAELVRQGIVRPGSGNRPELYPATHHRLSSGSVAELIDEDRGDR